MRLKDMFTVSKCQKVTEKQLLRVLTASICSIVLCMTCLAGTTWALFTVTIENTDNVIQIGKPEIVLTVDGGTFQSGNRLTADEHKIGIAHANDVDDLDRKSTLYVTLTVQRENEESINTYITLDHGKNYAAEIRIVGGKDAALCWEVSWFAPVNAIALIGDTLTVPGEKDVEETTVPTETDSTEESTEAPESVPDSSEESSEPTEPVPDPSEESAEPDPDTSEASSEPTEESSEPTESVPDSSEESSVPPESVPDPGDESAEPAGSVAESSDASAT